MADYRNVAVEQKASNLEWLRENVKRGTTVHVISRSVARSGMSRRVSMFVIRKGVLVDITGAVALAGILRGNIDDGLRIDGGGMDMHWGAVSRVSEALGWRMDTCGGPKCPLNKRTL